MAVTTFAVASGVFVRDFSGFGSGGNTPIEAGASFVQTLYAYQLTYDLAVFSTVNVTTSIEAAYSNWLVEFESNGSFVSTFRPPLPGIIQITITNQEDRRGQLGVSVLQLSGLPPELETSVLDPVLYVTVGFLAASSVAFAAGWRFTKDVSQ